VLRVRGIESVGDRERRFRVEDNGRAASEASLQLVSLYTRRLFAENEIAGECRATAEGVLVLQLPDADKTYFYDGIIFAALDVFNHPKKNPTITTPPVSDEDLRRR
jgi:hypothetical protein